MLRQEFPTAPIHASQTTADWMRDDPPGFYPLARQSDPDLPAELTLPDRAFPPGSDLMIGGARIETADFGPGESETATAYYLPDSGVLFTGDLTGERVTPALLEGNSCGWLVNLEKLASRFSGARTVYPGHGAAAPIAAQLATQVGYLRTFRALVAPSVTPQSEGGPELTPAELQQVLTELDSRYPDHPPVASLPDLQQINVGAVAAELRAEQGAEVPAPCRG